MVRMVPPYPRDGANWSEKQIFTALEGIVDRPDWVVIHSLSLGRNVEALTGESDFVVFVPGRGIVLIEAKSPKWVEYKSGEWYLDRTPKPTKDPLRQLEAGRRSIRAFLRERELFEGGEPIARLLWFTSIGRHQFENRSPGDMQLFEWELGWHDDLTKPAWLIDKVLDEHNAWFAEVDAVVHHPEELTADKVDAIVTALLGDFRASETKSDRKKQRVALERSLLDEQKFALELVEDNPHVYFDGPAGTGKSILLATAVKRLAASGTRTLVTCWNVLMVEELRRLIGPALGVEVIALADLLRSVAGSPEIPADAGDAWYREELPRRALAALQGRPYLGAYEAICVDEFQDVASSPALVDALLALSGTGSADGIRLLAAGDRGQRILGAADDPSGAAGDPFAVLKARVPDLVHARLRRNCRTAPSIIAAAETVIGRPFGFTGHRMSRSTEGGFDSVTAGEGGETGALSDVLKSLLEEYEPEDIVVLSPFGEKRSLVGEMLARQERSKEERWLRKQLQHEGGAGRIRWRSIFKFKGLEAEAVVLTDLDADAREFVATTGVAWSDLLYVGMTRGKYRCVVVG